MFDWKFSPGEGCSRNCIQIIDANENQTQFKTVSIDKAKNEDSFAIQLEYFQSLIKHCYYIHLHIPPISVVMCFHSSIVCYLVFVLIAPQLGDLGNSSHLLLQGYRPQTDNV